MCVSTAVVFPCPVSTFHENTVRALVSESLSDNTIIQQSRHHDLGNSIFLSAKQQKSKIHRGSPLPFLGKSN